MFAIGNDELKQAPKLGKTIICDMCGKRHKIQYGERILNDGRKIPDTTLAFYECCKQLYLAGISGKDIRKRFKK